MTQFVILVPDFGGRAVTGAFAQGLREMYPTAHLMFGLNGLPKVDLQSIAQSVPTFFDTLIYDGDTKIVGTLTALYNKALLSFAEGSVFVRLDSAEHDPNYIGILAKEADQDEVLVVGDLSFVEGQTLNKGTPDWDAHKEIFPKMYGDATQGKVQIGCAHGFMAAQAGVVKKILPRMLRILERAGQKAGQPLTWGFDGAMILAAVQEGVQVKISPVPAMILRNRNAGKVKDQTDQHCLLTEAAMEVAKEDGIKI
ncbi:MAG: hypothetical protein RJA61_301 [Candidatus Parcubacteria bacterium]|jgi:hypothetical protein